MIFLTLRNPKFVQGNILEEIEFKYQQKLILNQLKKLTTLLKKTG